DHLVREQARDIPGGMDAGDVRFRLRINPDEAILGERDAKLDGEGVVRGRSLGAEEVIERDVLPTLKLNRLEKAGPASAGAGDPADRQRDIVLLQRADPLLREIK